MYSLRQSSYHQIHISHTIKAINTLHLNKQYLPLLCILVFSLNYSFILLQYSVILYSIWTMTTTNSGISVTVLLSVLCFGLAMMFVGGWYFQSSLVELKAQQQETAQIVQQLKDKVRKQSKQLNELRLQLEMRQFKVRINSSNYNSNCS